jgi:antirestriction protein ArdC
MHAKKATGNNAAATKPAHPEWSKLLIDAVAKPGVVSNAYSRFWNYSVGNQLLALWQCFERNLDPGPIHTFPGWLQLGRHVKKGEKAITLCMPVTVSRKRDKDSSDSKPIDPANGADQQVASPGTAVGEAPAPLTKTVFTYKPHWFVLSQTDGDEYVATALPDWSEDRALEILKITRVTFRHTDGNCQGYASGRTVAVSPVGAMPHKTLVHEMAHVVLGHTTEDPGLLDDHEFTPRSLREAEAESVALIVCESLNLAGADFSRGYIQHWLAGQTIPERSAQKIFKAADQILKAGYPGDPPAPAPAEPTH